MPWPRSLRRVVFTLTPAVALFAALEIALRLGGLHYDPFDLMQPVLIPDGPAWLRTNPVYAEESWLDVPTIGPAPFVPRQRLAIEEAPGTLRVVLVGGSTVHLLYDAPALAERLRSEIGRDVEIVNLGFQGCGSERERRSVEQALRLEPDFIVLYTGHNEFTSFSNPGVFTPSRRWTALRALLKCRVFMLAVWVGAADRAAQHGAAERHAAEHGASQDRESWAAPPWESPVREFSPAEAALIHRAFEANVRAIAVACRDARVPLLLCTAASNLRLPPHPLPANAKTAMDRAPWRERSDEELATAAADEIQPDAAAAYVLGCRCAEREQWEDARRWLERGLDCTSRPTRASLATNTIVRQVATEFGVPLALVKEAIEAAAPHGILGEELFFDDCHLRPPGIEIMLQTIADALIEQFTPESRNHE